MGADAWLSHARPRSICSPTKIGHDDDVKRFGAFAVTTHARAASVCVNEAAGAVEMLQQAPPIKGASAG